MKKMLFALLAISGTSMTMAADKPFTAEVLVGQATFEIDDFINDDDTSSIIRLAYEFADSWSAEAAFQNYGDVSTKIEDEGDTETYEYSTSAFTLGVKKTFALNDQFSLNARAGIALWEIESVERDEDGTSTATNSSNDLYYGVGLDYALTDSLSLSAEYTMIAAEDDSTDIDLSNIAVGVGYQF
ncbi:porin family protein [Marinomonas sp. THO17]|uniref:porin family protein n=1 Tax=Marinomonas sp. THO17 TaxID=3149048 RepID=UPI00336C264A